MITNITKFFEDLLNPATTVDDSNDSHDIQFATAALLMEVSRSSDDKSDIERDAMLDILQPLFEFTEEEVSQLIDVADDATEQAHDLYGFTRLVNQHYEYGQKQQLVKNLWAVALADGRVDAYEEHIIRRISGLMHLANEDFIKAKIQARTAYTQKQSVQAD